MFSLLKKCRNLLLPLDIQIDLFEKCVNPVLLYGCEVWGFSDFSKIWKVQLKFLKIILGVKPSTPTNMVLGETGCYPISFLEMKSRVLVFWYRLQIALNKGSQKVSCLLLKLISYQYQSSDNKSVWLDFVYKNLYTLGLSYVENNQSMSVNQFKKVVKQNLKDQFLQMWSESVNTSRMTVNYRMFKYDLRMENYLLSLPESLRKPFLKFRTCNNNLPVNKARYLDIPRSERLCVLCDSNDIGDEFHYLFVCNYPPIDNERTKFIKRYYYVNPNVYKMQKLFESKGVTLIKLAKFLKNLLEYLKHNVFHICIQYTLDL